MRKLKSLLPLVLLLSFPWIARTQGIPLVPKFAIFGGGTIIGSQYDSGSGFGTSTFHEHGWEVSAEGKFLPFVGGVADVSQVNSGSGVLSLSGPRKQTMLLFGPQFSPHIIPHVIPFIHALGGVVQGTTGITAGGAVTTGTVFATAIGGGVDIKIFGPLWLRPVQFDYLHANFAPDHHTIYKVSAGFVLRL